MRFFHFLHFDMRKSFFLRQYFEDSVYSVLKLRLLVLSASADYHQALFLFPESFFSALQAFYQVLIYCIFQEKGCPVFLFHLIAEENKNSFPV